ncbi:MAG: pyrroline-5-carboxylate reductase [Lachnospiraceae bacterium]|jgi:pyrroline-5-carboxylate reductase
MTKIGFIGMGNMGYALLKGLLAAGGDMEIMFTCKTEEKKKRICKETGVEAALTGGHLATWADILILAVKPRTFDEVFEEIAGCAKAGMIIISLAPGWSSERIFAALKSKGAKELRVVRAMPNTPALIGCGMTGIAYDEERFTPQERRAIEDIFAGAGKCVRVTEEQMDAVVCASGSSPAYVYMFIEELAASVEKLGLDKDKALLMVSETVIGAAKMVQESGESPQVLRERVCSKGGTTIEGVKKLQERGFGNAIREATAACFERSREIGKQN